MKFKLYIIIFIIVTISSADSIKSEITFKNGDIKNGKIIGVKDNEIYFFADDTLFYFKSDMATKIVDVQGQILSNEEIFQKDYNIVNWNAFPDCYKIKPKKFKNIGAESFVDFELSLTQTEKIFIYEQQRKDPTIARMMSFYIPGSGHLYCGNFGKGVLLLAGTGGFTYLAFQKKPAQILGITGLIVTRLFDIFDSGIEADRFNIRLRQKLFGQKTNYLSLDIGTNDNLPQLCLSIKF